MGRTTKLVQQETTEKEKKNRTKRKRNREQTKKRKMETKDEKREFGGVRGREGIWTTD